MANARRDALILGGVGLAAAAAGALVGVFALQARSGAAELLAAPLHDLDGHQRRLLDWKGKMLLCNFWATWCAPCREEIPLLVAAKQQWLTPMAEIVGIAVDSAANVRQSAKTYKVNYPILVAGATGVELLRGLGNRAGVLPFSVVLDRNGALVQHWLGAFTESELRKVLAGLLR
jgi:thiol-disulfide isomerase/thioredoxin